MSRRPFEVHGGSVLVRAQNWIGDVVLGTASLRCIRRSLPGSKISVLARPWVIPLLAHSPFVDEIIAYDRDGRHKGVSGLLRLCAYLRGRRFQAAILIQRAFEAALIAFLAGIPLRMGYATDARGLLLTHKGRSSRREFDIPRLEHDLKLLEGFGLRVHKKDPFLAVGPEDEGKAERRLRELGVQADEPLVGMAPGAVGSIYKRWSPDRFARLAARIRKLYRAKVILFGSGSERELGEGIRRAAAEPGVVNLAGQTSLGEAMAMIGLCGLFVTNDSGLMHVAAAMDLPLVAIFGPTDPRRTAPWSRRSVLVRDEEVDCYGCKMDKCRYGNRCMERVTVEEAFAGVEEAVERFGMAAVGARREKLPIVARAVPIIWPAARPDP